MLKFPDKLHTIYCTQNLRCILELSMEAIWSAMYSATIQCLVIKIALFCRMSIWKTQVGLGQQDLF